MGDNSEYGPSNEGFDVLPTLRAIDSSMDEEVRREQARLEAEKRQMHYRKRSLEAVFAELAVRRAEVTLNGPELSLHGVVVHAAQDFVVLDVAALGMVSWNLAACFGVQVHTDGPQPAQPVHEGARTFRAKITEFAMEERAVVIHDRGGKRVQGVVVAAACDHVMLRTSVEELFVPYTGLVAVWLVAPQVA